MPPMIATPAANSEGKEHMPESKVQKMEQEFELDIRISSVNIPLPLMAPTKATGGCCTDALSCFGCVR